MSKGSRSKAAHEHLSKVAALGCVVCRLVLGEEDSPAEIQHMREGQGMGQRGSDFETYPLCPAHHRTGGPGVAFHATGREEWESKYGTEAELLADTLRNLGLGEY